MSSIPAAGRSPATIRSLATNICSAATPAELGRSRAHRLSAVPGSFASSSSAGEALAARSVRSGSAASALGAGHPQPPRLEVGAAAVLIEPLGGGELLDPHGGRADLEARRLRMVSGGALADDPLRTLRAVADRRRARARDRAGDGGGGRARERAGDRSAWRPSACSPSSSGSWPRSGRAAGLELMDESG